MKSLWDFIEIFDGKISYKENWLVFHSYFFNIIIIFNFLLKLYTYI